MSVPVDVTGSDGSRRAGSSLETVRAPRPPARTGAAKRAYDISPSEVMIAGRSGSARAIPCQRSL